MIYFNRGGKFGCAELKERSTWLSNKMPSCGIFKDNSAIVIFHLTY